VANRSPDSHPRLRVRVSDIRVMRDLAIVRTLHSFTFAQCLRGLLKPLASWCSPQAAL